VDVFFFKLQQIKVLHFIATQGLHQGIGCTTRQKTFYLEMGSRLALPQTEYFCRCVEDTA
jgi:phage anti-repressor protein